MAPSIIVQSCCVGPLATAIARVGGVLVDLIVMSVRDTWMSRENGLDVFTQYM